MGSQEGITTRLLVEVKVKDWSEPEHYRAIEVRLSKGRSLLVEPGFDASHLRALLSVEDGSKIGLPSLHTRIIRKVRESGLQQSQRICAVVSIGSRSH